MALPPAKPSATSRARPSTRSGAAPRPAADSLSEPTEKPASRELPSQELSSQEPSPQKKRRSALVLDLAAVADVDGLTQEVALLRASIRKLADDNADDATEHVKVLAELQHQVQALCTALKTQQALDGRDGSAQAADLAQTLDELGDELGVG